MPMVAAVKAHDAANVIFARRDICDMRADCELSAISSVGFRFVFRL
jgi:hypothetical protein